MKWGKPVAGLALGTILGVIGSNWWQANHAPKRPPSAAPSAEWLEGEELTLEKLFGDRLATLLKNPDHLEIHLPGGDGKLEVEGGHFHSQAVVLDGPREKILREALGSTKSYAPPGDGDFKAEALLRLTARDGSSHDLVFCFSCAQMIAHEDSGMLAGLSKDGRDNFRKGLGVPEPKE